MREGDRRTYLDVLRAFSVLCVVYTHFIAVGGGKIVPVLGPGSNGPLIDRGWMGVPIFLVHDQLSTHFGAIGVSMFFLITGYLMPTMMERYSRSQFLVNRFFRIFPTWWACLLIMGIVLAVFEGRTFGWDVFLANAFLVQGYLHIGVVISVIWTLMIEIAFYAIVAIVGRFSVWKFFATQASLVAFAVLFAAGKPGSLTYILASHVPFLLLILVGTSIYLSERMKSFGPLLVAGAIALSWAVENVMGPMRDTDLVYRNASTVLIVTAIFLAVREMSRANWFEGLARRTEWLSDMVYPVYLLHVPVGLVTMDLLHHVTKVREFIVFPALAVVLVVAWIVHVAVELPAIAAGRYVGRRFAPRPAPVATAT